MKLSLVVVTAGKAAGQSIPIPSAQFIIGRDPQCNLRPASAMISPNQKTPRSFSRKMKSANKATHKGAVLPSKVALAAVVYFNDEFQNAKSKAVKIPASKGKNRYFLSIGSSLLCCRIQIGVRKIVEISNR